MTALAFQNSLLGFSGTQGGESEFMSIATRADETNAVAAREIEVTHVVAHEVPDHALDVRIRHHGQSLRGRIVQTGDGTGRVVLEDAAEAVAPGQTAALYDEGRLVAAGTIARAPARVDRTEE